jgi:protein SCO1/2
MTHHFLVVRNSPLFRSLLAAWLLAAATVGAAATTAGAVDTAGAAATAGAAEVNGRIAPAADSTSSGSIKVVRAWSRSTAPGASVGVVYFEVINAGPADTLLAIECPAAERAEMHGTARVDGIMKMRPVASVDLPAGGRLSFQPGGLHAMLIGIKQPLKEGGRLPLTLVFQRAGKLRFEAAIQGLGTPDPPATAVPPPPADFRLAVWPQRAESPALRLLDFDGRPRQLADYRGRVLVIFFGFVRCPDACPAELFKLALAMKRLGPLSEHVQVLFVTLDPERDTPQVLKSYVTAFDPRFVGLTGGTVDIDRAAMSFYVEYARVGRGADYSIDHSTSSFVLDAHGRLRLVGTLDTTVEDWVHDLGLVATE